MAKQLTPAEVNAAYKKAQSKDTFNQMKQTGANTLGIMGNTIKNADSNMSQNGVFNSSVGQAKITADRNIAAKAAADKVAADKKANDAAYEAYEKKAAAAKVVAAKPPVIAAKPPVIAAKPPVVVIPPKTVTPVIAAKPPMAMTTIMPQALSKTPLIAAKPPVAVIKKANGGNVSSFAKGGSVKSSASRRGDGIAQRGKTRGMIR